MSIYKDIVIHDACYYGILFKGINKHGIPLKPLA